MALQLNDFPSSFGIIVPACYARVVGITANDTVARIFVEFFASQEAREAGLNPVDSRTYTATGFDLVTPVAIKEFLYNALKQHPDFANAIDC